MNIIVKEQQLVHGYDMIDEVTKINWKKTIFKIFKFLTFKNKEK